MKTFIAYPFDSEKTSSSQSTDNYSGKLVAHHELYQEISHLEGSVVKCGVTAKEVLDNLQLFSNSADSIPNRKVVLFEKIIKKLYVADDGDDNSTLQTKSRCSAADISAIKKVMKQKGFREEINFIPGNVGEAIPDFLIEYPDLKISYLNIDFDDYEATLTTLHFFYPRLVHHGILILDNFYKKEEDHRAVKEYFRYSTIRLNNFSHNQGPHYIVRQ
jgi:hypothetical protein